MYPDYHTHSYFSDDSSEQIDRMITRAIDLGMPAICLTDHHDTNHPEGEYRLDAIPYQQTVEGWRQRYADRIDVLCGVEIGIDPVLAKEQVVETYLQQGHFDYVIASLHYVDNKDPYYRDLFDCSDAELYRMYFDNLLEALMHTTGFHTVGHLDYVVRYGREAESPYSYMRYRDVIDAILEETIRRGLILEINTYGKNSDPKLFHPFPDVLRRYRELGGDRIIFGSDAHRADDIGKKFDTVGALVREIGFTHLTQVTREGEREIPL